MGDKNRKKRSTGSKKSGEMSPKQKRLAALAEPRNKITRADIIAGATNRNGKKSKPARRKS